MIEDDRNSRFSEAVLPHLPDALTTALWLAGNRTDAEDVVQETCLRAFRLIADFTSGNARDRVPHANLHPHAIAPSRRSSEIGAGGNANAKIFGIPERVS
jgi:hypothetical protein